MKDTHLTTPVTDAQIEFHPLDQFIVRPLFGGSDVHWYTVTNVTLWLAIAVALILLVMVVGTRKRRIVPDRMQSMAELVHGFVRRMVVDICGEDGLAFFPFVMTLFCFVLAANLVGLLPMSFATTSHIAVTGTLAVIVFGMVTCIGIWCHGFGFLSLFWPAQAPIFMRPVLTIIELISYFVRPLSHSVRLAGNLLAGHAVIKVFAAFAALTIAVPVSIVAVTAMFVFEVAVAVVQAYVFSILTCVYLKDALHPAH